MNKALTTLAFLAVLPATAALAADECRVPVGQEQSREALTQLTTEFGWTIDTLKIDDGCYNLRVTDESGNVFKVKIDPETMDVVDGEVESLADGSI
ncbi:hypothetical protein J2Y48_000232 [Mycoplana sp. BE70]|uniref:PepSY domain-containing protein n=1 Tax=Mycoplana sp. BE70 TaxID=2817775 RepID=UPI0028656ABF|nr:PepSY domain-containing protein [Mycoplana sp. BE70]MDR6754959.1 hypothetical protein [Mycoplana sp. BE70]